MNRVFITATILPKPLLLANIVDSAALITCAAVFLGIRILCFFIAAKQLNNSVCPSIRRATGCVWSIQSPFSFADICSTLKRRSPKVDSDLEYKRMKTLVQYRESLLQLWSKS